MNNKCIIIIIINNYLLFGVIYHIRKEKSKRLSTALPWPAPQGRCTAVPGRAAGHPPGRSPHGHTAAGCSAAETLSSWVGVREKERGLFYNKKMMWHLKPLMLIIKTQWELPFNVWSFSSGITCYWSSDKQNQDQTLIQFRQGST